MTEIPSWVDEMKIETKLQSGGDGAGSGGNGTPNWAGEANSGGKNDRFARGQKVTCRVGLCEYEGGYSVAVAETGDFGFLQTSAKLCPNEEIQAVFHCMSPVGAYDQYFTGPVFGLEPPSEQASQASLFALLAKTFSGLLNPALGTKDHSKGENSSPSIDTGFRFIDIVDLDFCTNSHLGGSEKRWSANEKQLIEALLERLNRDARGLLHLATIGGPIKLIRVEKIVESSGRCFSSAAGERKIKFADSFFSITDPFRAIVHEITHLADSDSHFVAHSKEWIELAEPIIAEFSVISNDADKAQFLRTKWPSEYACEDLQEALAEYVASYITNQYFESKEKFENTIVPFIIAPGAAVLQWKHLVVDVTAARNKTDLKLARKRLLKTARLFPDKPYSYLHLAGISATLGDLETTIRHTKQMLSAFELAGSSLKIEKEYIQLISRTFYGSRNREGAAKFADWLLSAYP